ncbi:MAG: hypothetical protein CMP10_21130 [Zetaproteobacteria bacterium]|nr:hypothetical protein [Pseudobdellovibrionaceae bacterium]|tara:strand:- start:400 stop:1326 length:927 start_codon:yes stop_codon:yes gene_type:complete
MKNPGKNKIFLATLLSTSLMACSIDTPRRVSENSTLSQTVEEKEEIAEDLKIANQRIEELNTRAEQIEENGQEIRDILERQLADVNGQLVEQQTTIATLEIELQTAFDMGNAERERLEEQLEQAKIKAANRTKRADTLTGNISSAKSTNQEQIASMKADLEKTTQECNRIADVITDLESKNEKLRKDIEYEEAKVELLTRGISDINKANAALSAEITELQARVKELSDQIVKLNEEFGVQQKTLRDEEAKLREVQTNLSAAQASLQEEIKRFEELTQSLKQKGEELSKELNETRDLEKELNGLKNQKG